MRRPNDPTGGIDRPPPEPTVALVPPSSRRRRRRPRRGGGRRAGAGDAPRSARPPRRWPTSAAAAEGVAAAAADAPRRTRRRPRPALRTSRRSGRRAAPAAAATRRRPAAAVARRRRALRRRRRPDARRARRLARLAGRPPSPGTAVAAEPAAAPPAAPTAVAGRGPPSARSRAAATAAAAGCGSVSSPSSRRRLAGAWPRRLLLFKVPKHPVPELVGRPSRRPGLQTAEFDWDIESRHERSDEQPDAGEIIRTARPPASSSPRASRSCWWSATAPSCGRCPTSSALTQAEAERRSPSSQPRRPAGRPSSTTRRAGGSVISWSVPADAALDGRRRGAARHRGRSSSCPTGPPPRTIPTLSALYRRPGHGRARGAAARRDRRRAGVQRRHPDRQRRVGRPADGTAGVDARHDGHVVAVEGPRPRRLCPTWRASTFQQAHVDARRAGLSSATCSARRGHRSSTATRGRRDGSGRRQFVRGTGRRLMFLPLTGRDRGRRRVARPLRPPWLGCRRVDRKGHGQWDALDGRVAIITGAGRGSGASTRCCSPPRAPRSSSTTVGGANDGSGADITPAQ